MSEVEEFNQQKPAKTGKQHNVLPIWGNEQTMNLNPLILANIQGSSYFKVHLFKLKTYHEVVDEIYYQVKHLEPWERGSRKTAGQTGMCGGVRGVGAGGIVSTAFCLLYKLYTLRLTRKQVNGLLQHSDSPYIRALGFMYIRYTQPPADLFDWYADYLDDEEEIDPRAGGGGPTNMGALVRQMLIKLDWFSTLFPRIPVPIQKLIEQKLGEHNRQTAVTKPVANFRDGGGSSNGGNSNAGGGGGGPGAGAGANAYNPGRMDADRREHDDRDRRDYGEVDRYSKDRTRRDEREVRDRDRDRDRERGDRGERGGGDRGERGGADRGDRGGSDRGDRGGADRGDRGGADRSDRSGADRGDRGGADRGDRGGSDRGDRGGADRGDRGGSDRGDRGGSDRGDRGGADRSDRGDRDRDRRDRDRRDRHGEKSRSRDRQRHRSRSRDHRFK